ncbi:hypothetical protein [Thiothrix nivea]|uniref:Uncharacterized protein n=1 Tax=Thiothrix nivea (strain ATCC 35100 / DSM 5205 / JP2) TaxID=870187 RepID=A0A656HDM8_THINJ|nr:hypothetical protein [Thiothrix nivea]EIJ34084.1 hypothetical protein Thini_1481 [Thiothrix nivea DSM 5205]
MAERNDITGEELGKKLLQAVKEMKAGQADRVTSVEPNKLEAARLATGLLMEQTDGEKPNAIEAFRGSSKIKGSVERLLADRCSDG